MKELATLNTLEMESNVENKIILLCQDSIDGIFTAIYEGFRIKNEKYGAKGENYQDNIEICMKSDYEISMFAQYISVETDYEKSYKTAGAIKNRMGIESYYRVLNALCHFSSDRGTKVFGYLIRGFKMGEAVMEILSDRYVMDTMELARKANNEALRFKGFVRFKEIGNTLYSVIEPKCNMIPLIGGHFSDRYPNENWIIYDKNRKLAAVHRKYDQWIIVDGDSVDGQYLESEFERQDHYGELWKAFYNAVYIKERKNEKCQNNMIPKWYRKNMLEFKK